MAKTQEHETRGLVLINETQVTAIYNTYYSFKGIVQD